MCLILLNVKLPSPSPVQRCWTWYMVIKSNKPTNTERSGKAPWKRLCRFPPDLFVIEGFWLFSVQFASVLCPVTEILMLQLVLTFYGILKSTGANLCELFLACVNVALTSLISSSTLQHFPPFWREIALGVFPIQLALPPCLHPDKRTHSRDIGHITELQTH